MAIAKISGNHWKLPDLNGIDTIYEQSCNDIISGLAENDAANADVDFETLLGKTALNVANNDAGYDAWDAFEELCDESDDWLADLYRKNYIRNESE